MFRRAKLRGAASCSNGVRRGLCHRVRHSNKQFGVAAPCVSACGLALAVDSLAAAQALDADDAGCWIGGFDPEICCGHEFGTEGHPTCFNQEFPYHRCCHGQRECARRRAEAEAWWQAWSALPFSSPSTPSAPSEPSKAKVETAVEFDYIIVGSGSGGATAAATLAASPKRPSVLLLEAGEWDVPAEYYRSSVVNASFNRWGRPVFELIRSAGPFVSSKTPSSGLKYSMKVGRALGGGSAVNRGFHSCGGTAELASGLAWPETEIQASFTRLNNMYSASAARRGHIGPVIRARALEQLPPFVRNMVVALDEAGVPFRADPHDGDVRGRFTRTLHGAHGGTWLSLSCPKKSVYVRSALDLSLCARQTAYSLVAPWNRSAQNLVVRAMSLATRLHWAPPKRRAGPTKERLHAIGVDVVELTGSRFGEEPHLGQILSFQTLREDWTRRLSRRYTARAKRGVIISAGAVGTPALLMRSGVGPSESVGKTGAVPRWNTTAVGNGLKDRIAISAQVITDRPCTEMALRNDDDIPVLFAFYNFTSANKPGDLGPVEAELNVLDGCMGFAQQLGFALRFILQRTDGQGSVYVASPHPFVSPHAELHASQRDLHRMVAMLRWFHDKVLEHPAVKPHVVSVDPPLDVLNDARKAEEFVKRGSQWYLHPSNSMVEAVDRDLRLANAANVHIADASVLPHGLPSGHPDVTARMIGEVVAQRLLQKHGAVVS